MKFTIEQKLPIPKGLIQCVVSRAGIIHTEKEYTNTFTINGVSAYIAATSHSVGSLFRQVAVSFSDEPITHTSTQLTGPLPAGRDTATGNTTTEVIDGVSYIVLRRTRIYEPGQVEGTVRQFGIYNANDPTDLSCGVTVSESEAVEVTVEDQLTVNYFVLIPNLSNPATLYQGPVTIGGDAGGEVKVATYTRQHFVDTTRPYFPRTSTQRIRVNGNILNANNYNTSVVRTINTPQDGIVEWEQDIRVRASAGNLNINTIDFFETSSNDWIGRLAFDTPLVKSGLRKLDIQVRYRLVWTWD